MKRLLKPPPKLEEPPEIPWVRLSDIYELFGYPTYAAAKKAVVDGRFPIYTFRLANSSVADKAIVRAFFLDHREEALKKLAEDELP